MNPDQELHSEFWRSIALTVLWSAPHTVREAFAEFGQVPIEQSILRLRRWNDDITHRLQVQACNEMVRPNAGGWRN